MAMIAREAFDNEALLEIASARSYRLPATINNPEGRSLTAECRILNTTDPDSQYYFPDAVAAKTGYTSLAGNTLVLYAEPVSYTHLGDRADIEGAASMHGVKLLGLCPQGGPSLCNMDKIMAEGRELQCAVPLLAGEQGGVQLLFQHIEPVA